MIKIVGSYLSPYVRKVLACLEAKGLGYEVDPIVPFFGDDRHHADMSPCGGFLPSSTATSSAG